MSLVILPRAPWSYVRADRCTMGRWVRTCGCSGVNGWVLAMLALRLRVSPVPACRPPLTPCAPSGGGYPCLDGSPRPGSGRTVSDWVWPLHTAPSFQSTRALAGTRLHRPAPSRAGCPAGAPEGREDGWSVPCRITPYTLPLPPDVSHPGGCPAASVFTFSRVRAREVLVFQTVF